MSILTHGALGDPGTEILGNLVVDITASNRAIRTAHGGTISASVSLPWPRNPENTPARRSGQKIQMPPVPLSK